MTPGDQPPAQPLTLEVMRADIARIIHADVEEVGDDDNLMDLGLDSMRMLSLVAHWGESVAGLEFSALAEYVTVKQWWQVVQTLQSEASKP